MCGGLPVTPPTRAIRNAVSSSFVAGRFSVDTREAMAIISAAEVISSPSCELDADRASVIGQHSNENITRLPNGHSRSATNANAQHTRPLAMRARTNESTTPSPIPRPIQMPAAWGK